MAVLNNGTLINGDSIIVQGTCTSGITNNGKIENQSGASIISITDVPIGIANNDSLQNDGFIYIDNADKGIQNDGYIINQDSMSLRNNEIGFENRQDTSILLNNGGINIFAESGEHSMLINGSVENNGSITVYQLIEVRSGGTLSNKVDASLSIFWGRGSAINYLLIQNGGELNGFPIIQALEGGR